MAARVSVVSAVALVSLGLVSHISAAAPTTVYIVRHAERAAEPATDPGLTPAGVERARRLAEALESAKVSAIITTPLRRTRETAHPLAQRLGIEPLVIGFRKGEFTAHVPEVVAAIAKMDGNVLVVGHANTAPQIANALTGERMMDFCETSFSHVLVVNVAAKTMARLRYGESDPKPTDGCQ